jgi:UDP-N-acetylglucosamine 2-epimerase
MDSMKDQKYYQKQREAILNDSHRKELFKALFDLYAKSMPIVLKTKDNQIECSYSNEVEELAEKIREQIRLRDNQVFEATSNYPRHAPGDDGEGKIRR